MSHRSIHRPIHLPLSLNVFCLLLFFLLEQSFLSSTVRPVLILVLFGIPLKVLPLVSIVISMCLVPSPELHLILPVLYKDHVTISHTTYNIPSVAATCQQSFFHIVWLTMPSFSFVLLSSVVILRDASLLASSIPSVSAEPCIDVFEPSLSHEIVSLFAFPLPKTTIVLYNYYVYVQIYVHL